MKKVVGLVLYALAILLIVGLIVFFYNPARPMQMQTANQTTNTTQGTMARAIVEMSSHSLPHVPSSLTTGVTR